MVSRALNNSGYVEAKKKERILKIAEELGYHPNPVAMSLMQQRTRQILFYCKDLKNAYNIEMYEGMLEAASKRGYMVVLGGYLNFSDIRNIMTDGLILPNETLAKIYLDGPGKNYYLPTVASSLGSSITFPRSIPVVRCDLWKGTRRILQYLHDMGHHRIAMVSPYDLSAQEIRQLAWVDFVQYELGEQMDDYFFGMNRKGLVDDSRILKFQEEKNSQYVNMAESFFEKGELAAEIFQERKCNATAVLCFNDEMALGFCRQLKKLGFLVPEDISVVGFDGTYSRRYAEQMVTTLALNPRHTGSKCVEVLLDMIDGKKIKYVSNIQLNILEGDTVKNIRR